MKKKMAQKRYTREEVAYLFDNYGKLSIEAMASDLDRTKSQISAKLHYLGLSICSDRKLTKRSEQLNEQIAKKFGTVLLSDLSNELGVSASTIQKRYRNILIRKGSIKVMKKEVIDNIPLPFTDEDLKIIRMYYPTEGANCRYRMKEEHSRYTVVQLAYRNGIRFDSSYRKCNYPKKKPVFNTPENQIFVKNAYGKYSRRKLAEQLGCSVSTVRNIYLSAIENSCTKERTENDEICMDRGGNTNYYRSCK